MKTIKFRVCEEDFEKLTALSREHGKKTAAALAKDIMLSVIPKVQSEQKSKTDEFDDDYLMSRITVYVTEAVYREIQEDANSHGWTLSKEVRQRIYRTISDEPVMFDDELKVLGQIKNEIVKAGININHILRKKLLIDVGDPGFREDIKMLRANTDKVRRTFDRMAKARGNLVKVKRG